MDPGMESLKMWLEWAAAKITEMREGKKSEISELPVSWTSEVSERWRGQEEGEGPYFELKFLNELYSENMSWIDHSETYILVQEFCLFS